jgi:DNA-binding transcriptional MerR regulator
MELKDYKKKYYTIKEVSEKFLYEEQSVLRVWGKSFEEILPVHTNAHKTRFYTPENIEMLKDIKILLREKGYKHEGALEKLKNDRLRVRANRDVVERLTAVRNDLRAIRLELNKTEALAETVVVQ